MGDKVKDVLNKIKEFWNKYTTKQKIIISSVVAVVIVTFIILFLVFSKTTYVPLITCANATEAMEVRDLMDEKGYDYKLQGSMSFSINESQYNEAILEIGGSGVIDDGYSLTEALSGGFNSTESDKDRKYVKYLEEKTAAILEGMSSVKSASVSITVPENDETLLANQEEVSVAVKVERNGEITMEMANTMANFLMTAVGNTTTEKITIIDQNMNSLFSGAAESSAAGSASSKIGAKAQAENALKENVTKMLTRLGLYDNAEVVPNLILDFDEVKKVVHEYYANEDREEGMISHQDTYESNSTNGSGGTPGTASNDDTDYVIQDSEENSSTVEDASTDYLPNEVVEEIVKSPGAVEYESSSISIVATHEVTYREEDLKEQGLLEGISFERYVEENSAPVATEVSAELITSISKATGIPEDNISILAYDVPVYETSTDDGFTIADLLQIIMVVLILGLLGFVVFMTLRPAVVNEIEPDVPVEQLLQDTKAALEDIEYDDRSEARKLIEKFVDENPDAVAQLLRNWLNDDWE